MGAGGGPSASAVVADVIDLAQRLVAGQSRVPAPTYDDRYRFRPMDEVCTRYYLRVLAEDRPGVFAQITHALGEARISLASVIQKQNVRLDDSGPEYAEIVLMTHEATEAPMQQAVRAMAALPVVHEIGSLIRVER